MYTDASKSDDEIISNSFIIMHCMGITYTLARKLQEAKRQKHNYDQSEMENIKVNDVVIVAFLHNI
jgi:preprotein translocase subunit YajC